jgi:hypothetical protein
MKRFVVLADGRDVDGESVDLRNAVDTTINGVKLKGYRLDEFDSRDDAELYATIARKNGFLWVKVVDAQPAAG